MNFVVMPVLSGALLRDFHPDQLVDPPWMAQWLREYDPESETLPLWTQAGLGQGGSTAQRELFLSSLDGVGDESDEVGAEERIEFIS